MIASHDHLDGIRIGLVGPLPPPHGGMSNQTRQLARLLADSGMIVDLVRTNAPYRPGWVANLRGIRALFRLAPYFLELWRCIGRVDVVHVMSNSGWAWHLLAAPAIWISSLRGVPVVVNYRGGEANAFLTRSTRIVKTTMARASALIVPSGFLRGVFARHGIEAQIVPNVVDTACFARKESNSTATAPHLIVTRNLEPIYDNATAIRAFALVRRTFPGARLSVAGVGPDRDALERLVAELGLADAVTFTGQLDREQVASLFRSADVMINASRVDNTPNAILEALATGIPVVSTDVGGIPFLVQHEKTALLVGVGDHEALAAAAVRCLTDRALAERLVTNGWTLVDGFTWPAVRQLLSKVYHEAMARTWSAAEA
jgi:glycosyltransferase involved in cell wall biosynthesis